MSRAPVKTSELSVTSIPVSQPVLSLLHDDDDDNDDDFAQFSKYEVKEQDQAERSERWRIDIPGSNQLPTTSGVSVPSGSGYFHVLERLPLDKVPTLKLVNIRAAVSPRLLFRKALPQPSSVPVDPFWFSTSEDAALDRLWDLNGQLQASESTSFLSKYFNLPSTGFLMSALRKKQSKNASASLSEMGDRESEYRGKSSDNYNSRLINHTRSLLEKQNVLREIEDLKTREDVLVQLRHTILRHDVLRLSGAEFDHSPMSVAFGQENPDILSRLMKVSKRKGTSAWSCNILTFREVCEALQTFDPPLFIISPTASKTLVSSGTPTIRMSRAIVEQLGLVLEAQMKYILTILLKQLSAKEDERASERQITLSMFVLYFNDFNALLQTCLSK